MKLQFLGAAGTVTGSCYFLTSESGQSIFIDCGMFQGSQQLDNLNYTKFDCDVSSAIGMVLTHAHMDHCGRIPRLLRQGFKAPIYMTAPTYDIVEISLFDSAKIGVHEKGAVALYDKTEVEETLDLFKIAEYHKPFQIGPFTITMYDAGHILGSTSLKIVDTSARGENKTIVFSGDLGNSPQDLIKKTESVTEADVVVMESTYGDETHPVQDPAELLQHEINEVEKSGGTLLIPAFSIQRSQELLHKMHHLKKGGKVKDDTAVFFDGPMGEKVTQVFRGFPELFNDELKQDFAQGDPFWFPGLVVVEDKQQSAAIDKPGQNQAQVIIAGSGMMNGGRIISHAAHFLPFPTTRLFMVGYQAENTLGRQILDGEKDVMIDDQHIHINATVSQTQSMSSHADQPKLLDWVSQIKGVKKVFLTHGEDESRTVLAAKIKTDLNLSDTILPTRNQIVEF